MRTLSVAQPWASLAARGVCRFLAREWADTYRGTVAIHATDVVDADAIDRLSTDTEFAERLAAAGLHSSADIEALPRSAIVGAAVIADLWSLESLEEVATEDDAILLGDVVPTAVFWELAEAVAIEGIPHAPNAPQQDDARDEASDHAADVGSDDADADVDDDGDDDAGDVAGDEAEAEQGAAEDEAEEPAEEAALAAAARDLEPLDDELAARVRAAVEAAGARFDSDDLVFWPVQPSASLAALIGDDALGDREITQRVWAYVVEQDLQDPEDHTFVYLDDTLRAALGSDADGVPTIEFTDLIVAQMVRVT
jgi:upstream activation factor subunit UAF30